MVTRQSILYCDGIKKIIHISRSLVQFYNLQNKTYDEYFEVGFLLKACLRPSLIRTFDGQSFVSVAAGSSGCMIPTFELEKF